MSRLPSARYLQKLSSKLFSNLALQSRFQETFLAENAEERSRVAIELTDNRGGESSMTHPQHLAFLPPFVRVMTADVSQAEFDAGDVYICDLSSVTLASILTPLVARNIRRIIDLCASPGGKSIFSSRLLQPKILIANETIASRQKALISNFSRCRIPSAGITGSDPSFFANTLPEEFDLAIVDAPCSGQSLRLKGVDVRDCFHPMVVSRNAGRQKRILAHGLHTVQPGGYLAYMTCTFSPEENEEVIVWALKKFPGTTPIEITAMGEFRSPLVDLPCYRVYPWQNAGVGGFAALLKKEGEPVEVSDLPPPDLRYLWQSFQPGSNPE